MSFGTGRTKPVHQDYTIRTYEMSGEGGLPIAHLRTQTGVMGKRQRCVTVLTEAAGTVSAGVGAIVGLAGAPFCIANLASYWMDSDYDGLLDRYGMNAVIVMA